MISRIGALKLAVIVAGRVEPRSSTRRAWRAVSLTPRLVCGRRRRCRTVFELDIGAGAIVAMFFPSWPSARNLQFPRAFALLIKGRKKCPTLKPTARCKTLDARGGASPSLALGAEVLGQRA